MEFSKKVLIPFMVVTAIGIYLSIIANPGYGDSTDALSQNDIEMAERINKVEKTLDEYISRLKLLEEKEDFFIVFDTYRIGLVGVVLSCSGLIVAFFVALMSYRAYKTSQEVKQIENDIKKMGEEAGKILNNMTQKRKDIDNFIEKFEKNLILMIDQTLLSLAQLSEKKALLLGDLTYPVKVKELKDLVDFTRNAFETERDALQKVFYKVNLFHPDKQKVSEALMVFHQTGELEDIPTIQSAQKTMSEDNRNKAGSVIRTIKKRTND